MVSFKLFIAIEEDRSSQEDSWVIEVLNGSQVRKKKRLQSFAAAIFKQNRSMGELLCRDGGGCFFRFLFFFRRKLGIGCRVTFFLVENPLYAAQY